MKYKSSEEIRQLFLDFFASKGHAIEPSAPLVPINDPTLLWINSGVAALKKYFDGSVQAKNPRIANAQKSLRTNDIENVGLTARHQTFFEMLGNFSIGDYFKKEAIAFAYEFLFSDKWLGLDVNKAYITVHTDDDEAYRYWTLEQNIPASRILRTEHNFWQIGNGPCGPNSEIFYDRGVAYDPENIGEKLFFEDIENDRYVEVWNIVFSQYNGIEGEDPKTFEELPQKNIDTGMGFERLVSIVQEVRTNFDTDLFTPIIKKIESYTEVKYEENRMAYCVIGDHIRAITFALADGALFANEGRGYVLRRLLRRAVRYGKVLGIEGSFLKDLVSVVIEKMKAPYPYLVQDQDMIKKLVATEEKRFAKTLNDGEILLLDALKSVEGKTLSGEIAFKLYDTYGFPIELTQEIASEHGVEVDLSVFKQELSAQKERARQGREKIESMNTQNEDLLNFVDDSKFLYNTMECTAEVIALFKDGKKVNRLEGRGLVVVDQTPFYAESGGQTYDTGWINDDFVSKVTKANHGQHLHELETDCLEVGDHVQLKIDVKRRLAIRKNHSAVHLLQAALQTVLGEHVKQAGSYVDDKYLRFDFNHYERVSEKDLRTVSDLVNTWIQDTLEIKTDVMSLEEAKKTGAMALFSENYGDFVRVVSMGDVSKELCGGTHALNTSELGLFVISSEESVGSGIRRISAKTGKGAYQEFLALEEEHESIRETLKLPKQKTILERLNEMHQDYESLDTKFKTLQRASLRHEVNEILDTKQISKDGLDFVYLEFEKRDSDELKELVDRLGARADIVFAVNKGDSSLQFVVACSEKAITKGIKAGDLAKSEAIISGGNGGGRPNFAQAGGKDLSKLAAVKLDLQDKCALLLPIH